MSRLGRHCLSAAAGLLVDRLLGEPSSAVHPVAGFGRVMQRIEKTLWADRRLSGAVYAACGVAIGAVAGCCARSTVASVYTSVAGKELREVALRIGRVAASGDLPVARAELPCLVGRDPSGLDSSGIAAAVIESVAENSVDAVIAPVFWATVAGAPGAATYRAINTMDAMVGRLNHRYRNFGWAAARLDDAANFVPARIFAALVAISRPTRARDILTAIRQDAPAHPSPNAGVAEAAVAAALGRRLGGPLQYDTVTENRPLLGIGSRPTVTDIPSAVQLVNRAEWLAVTLLVLVWLVDWLVNRKKSPLSFRW